MPVVPRRKDMELLSAVSGVTVPHQPELLQHVQGSMHRRWNGRMVARAAALHELGSGDVTVGAREDVDHGRTLRRPAQALGAEPVGDAIPGIE